MNNITVSLTIAGNVSREIQTLAGTSLHTLLTQQQVDRTGASVSINGSPKTDTQVSSYTLNDEDTIFVSRMTKLG